MTQILFGHTPRSEAKARLPFHVVVANKAAARVYERNCDDNSHTEYGRLLNPTARKRLRELDSDRAGRSFDRHGCGRHALTKDRNTKSKASQEFVKDIAQMIRNLLKSSSTKRYALVAAPAFLGELRQELERTSMPSPLFVVDKDFVDQSLKSVQGVLLQRAKTNRGQSRH